MENSLSTSYPPTGIGGSFWWWDALPRQPVGIMEETLGSGNLLNCSSIPYLILAKTPGYIADGPTPVGADDRRGGPSRRDGRSQVVLIYRILLSYIFRIKDDPSCFDEIQLNFDGHWANADPAFEYIQYIYPNILNLNMRHSCFLFNHAIEQSPG